MPIISELKARAAWARHPDEHVAVCTVLGGGVPRARAQKLQSGFRSLGFLSCKGHHSQSWGPGHTPGAWPLIPGLCSEKACSRPHYTEALIARVTWTPACALHLRRVSASLRPSSATQPQPLPCAAARRRSGFPPQHPDECSWVHTDRLPCSRSRGLPARQGNGAWPGAQPTARPGEWLSGGGLTAALTGT